MSTAVAPDIARAAAVFAELGRDLDYPACFVFAGGWRLIDGKAAWGLFVMESTEREIVAASRALAVLIDAESKD